MDTITITQPNGLEADIRIDAVIAVEHADYADKSKDKTVHRTGSCIVTMAKHYTSRSTPEQVLDAIGAARTKVLFGKKKGRRKAKDDESGTGDDGGQS